MMTQTAGVGLNVVWQLSHKLSTKQRPNTVCFHSPEIPRTHKLPETESRSEETLARKGGMGVPASWLHQLGLEPWKRFGNWQGRWLHNILNAMKATDVVHLEMFQMVPGILYV